MNNAVKKAASRKDSSDYRHVETDLQLAALVFRHSDEGMMVSDADNRIIAVNPAFTRLTGYTLEEAIGCNPKLISSGRQGKAFYEAMWRSLQTTGSWQGQIRNRRKSGEEFVERLTIKVIPDEKGRPYRYVALFSDITEKVQFDELLWKQANFDSLTQLPNRRLARDRLEQELRNAQRSGAAVAWLLVELDRFREVNDALGYEVGDAVLAETVRRLEGCVRRSDTLARTGGDEFAVLLTDVADTSRVEFVAQAILQTMHDPFLVGDEKVYLSASIGITVFPDDAGDAEQLFRNANQALHEAKKSGRNCHSYFTHSMQEATRRRALLVREMHQAVEAGQFELVFQPVVEMLSGRIVKAEALLRWRHPQRGMISPGEFIPAAEATGLIVPMGDWAFREAARWARRWNDLRPQGFQMSVNVSPVQFQRHERMAADWIGYCRELALPCENIVLEITESLLLEAAPDVANTLGCLRDAGMQVALDDFGTGYSALAYLKRFDPDYLKIDQSFVRDLETDPDDLGLSEAIILMAHKLGLKVIAEGVEGIGQKNLLAAAGCHYGQGYLFSRPVDAAAFEKLLKTGYAG